jgi:DNA-binding YbaB/EbfC family protein
MKDIGAIMRQAQAMQAKIAEAQKKMETLEVEGAAGGGLVKIRLTGKHQMLSVSIDRSLMTPDEGEIVEDLVKAAFEDARRKIEDAQNEEFKAISGGMGMLPGFKMPF